MVKALSALRSVICWDLSLLHALRRSVGRSWHCLQMRCAVNLATCCRSCPAPSTGRRLPASMTKWSSTQLPCSTEPQIQKQFYAALPAPKLCTQPIKRWLNWVELSRQFSCADICALKIIVAKSTKGLMWWRTGTAPTALCSSARAGRLLVTALKIRRSRPCLCTCCRPRWFTSTPAWCNRCFQILFGLADLPQKITEV
ncbi:hypothetical protein PsAD37_04312 [Pseudovibrio sp. Ad37]|nr:hypothetical protein PsAD37_04312 [Pseudovibrio sp. Ad37]